jgi:hypothetical protein
MTTPVREEKAIGPTRPHTLLVLGPVVAFGLLLLGLSRNAGTGISDPDAPWHVLAGRHLWDTWQFHGPDPYSRFTTGPWVLNQWLPDLVMAGADRIGGLAAVAWLAQLGRLAVCVLLYAACRRRAGSLPAAFVAGAAVLGTADSLSPRPQLVGFALLALTVDAWLRTVSDLRPRWWLVPVAYLWACCHGTWVVGLTVGAAAVVGLVLDRRVQLRRDRQLLLRLAAIPVASGLVALVTPVGPSLLTSFSAVRAVSPYIQEWRLPTTPTPSVLATAALLLLVPLVWVLRRERVAWTHVALWLLAVAWGLSSMRTVAVGAIVVAPLAAEALGALLGRERNRVERAERVVVGSFLVAAAALSGLLAAAGPSTPAGAPHAFDSRLQAMPPGTVVYNTDLLGGWLMYSHPELAHTADTRAELYGPVLVRSYLDVMAARPGWEQDLDHFAPQAAILEKGLPVVDALRSRGWQVLGQDAGYVLLEPAAPR